MFSIPPETSFTIFGLSTKDALLLLSAVGGPVLAYFAARSSAFAQLQKTVFDASAQFVQGAQTQHAADLVRISELEAEILRQRGVVDGQIQHISSCDRMMERKQRFIDDLVQLCHDHKVGIPKDWHV